jgi:hypothetical protein
MTIKNNIRQVLANVYVAQHQMSTAIVQHINDNHIGSEYLEVVTTLGARVREDAVEVIRGKGNIKEGLVEVMAQEYFIQGLDMAGEAMVNDMMRIQPVVQPVVQKAKGLVWWLTGKHV